MFQRTADKPGTLKAYVYLSVSDFVGGEDFVGEDTVLVSGAASLKRPALTSATLHDCTLNSVLSFLVRKG